MIQRNALSLIVADKIGRFLPAPTRSLLSAHQSAGLIISVSRLFHHGGCTRSASAAAYAGRQPRGAHIFATRETTTAAIHGRQGESSAISMRCYNTSKRFVTSIIGISIVGMSNVAMPTALAWRTCCTSSQTSTSRQSMPCPCPC